MENNDIQCLCENGIVYLTNLTSLSLDLESNVIGDDGSIELGDSLTNLSLLSYLNLNLKDNYIDNTGFAGLLNKLTYCE